jgi:tetratricopeptide (TPR) repeat protein
MMSDIDQKQKGGRNVSVGGDVDRSVFVTGNDASIYQVQSVTYLHQLPAPPKDFTGREAELQYLMENLEKGVTISGLRGQGGVGKTALALKLAAEIKHRYPDAQFFLDLKGVSDRPLSTGEAMAHVIRAFHPEARLPEEEALLSALYNSVLSDKRALIVMDNARDRAQVEPLIPPDGCMMIVTSRAHFTLPGMREQDLDTLPPADARDLLLKIAERIGGRADEIAGLCGYLPLALRVAASALNDKHRNLSAADYVRRLSDAKRRLSHLKEVNAALSVSYELIGEERQKLWWGLGVFPGEFDDGAAAAVWEMEADAATDALGDLLSYSLIEYDEKARRYSLHDLARLFADERLSDEERDALKRRHATHYAQVLASSGELYLKGGESVVRGLALFDLERGNIEAGWAWAAAMAEKEEQAAELCIEYPNAGAYVLNLRQHPRERIRWLEAMLAAARRLNRRRYKGIALGNLGLAYADLGETSRAIEYYEQHLTIAREIGDRRGEGIALGNLGLAYADLGETRRAIEYYEQHLTIAREIGDRRGEGIALGSLGLAYADLGETRRAIDFYEQRLVTAREIGDLRGEGMALWNMSLALDKLGERAKAIEYAEASLKIKEEIEDPRAEKVRGQLEEWKQTGG